ncbi:NmrA family NAD(P)-binding protein [Nocardia sp. NPDC057227]|uniref:NmrA family NAD(P)-binding protein n=1 Tax=Nocardia sp. NPDC057227 TaxID=3346056 RepID=UPI0036280B4B
MEPFVLVSGATGRQGGATALALLARGIPVHALVRDAAAPRARELETLGATLVRGDLDDPDSIAAAVSGAHAVFSVQTPDLADLLGDAELGHGRTLLAAARAAGVRQVVHTSVSGTAGADLAELDTGRWGAHMPHYWRSKAAVEEIVRDSGFPAWTILRPATFMENFTPGSFYYDPADPNRLLLAVDPDRPQPFVAVADIGAAAAAAFADPDRFAGVELELAGDLLTFREAAALLAAARGGTLALPDSPEDAVARGLPAEFARSQRYMTAHTAPARPEFARALGLPTTSFRDWATASLA